MGRGEALSNFRYNLVNYDYTEFIAQCPVPYTLIRCEFDKGINGMLKSTLKAIGANSSAKVIDLKGVGHVGNLDDPVAFNTWLKDILKKYSYERLPMLLPTIFVFPIYWLVMVFFGGGQEEIGLLSAWLLF